MRNIAAAAALAILASAPVMAQTATTMPIAPVTEVRNVADLAAVCDPAASNPLRLESIAYCQGYLTGAGQYYAAMHPPGTTARPLFCVPQPAPTVAQTGLAFAAWARQNTQYSDQPAPEGLLRYAQATFPCPPATPAPRSTRPGTAR